MYFFRENLYRTKINPTPLNRVVLFKNPDVCGTIFSSSYDKGFFFPRVFSLGKHFANKSFPNHSSPTITKQNGNNAHCRMCERLFVVIVYANLSPVIEHRFASFKLRDRFVYRPSETHNPEYSVSDYWRSAVWFLVPCQRQ